MVPNGTVGTHDDQFRTDLRGRIPDLLINRAYADLWLHRHTVAPAFGALNLHGHFQAGLLQIRLFGYNVEDVDLSVHQFRQCRGVVHGAVRHFGKVRGDEDPFSITHDSNVLFVAGRRR